MKTLGQVLRDAVALLREENAKRYRDNQDQITNEQSDEIVAQAVLAHVIANAEPVAYVHLVPDVFSENYDVRFWKHCGIGTKLFTVPQPLPSAEEIAETLFDADGVAWSWLEATNEQKEKYRVKAKAVEALLKGEK